MRLNYTNSAQEHIEAKLQEEEEQNQGDIERFKELEANYEERVKTYEVGKCDLHYPCYLTDSCDMYRILGKPLSML